MKSQKLVLWSSLFCDGMTVATAHIGMIEPKVFIKFIYFEKSTKGCKITPSLVFWCLLGNFKEGGWFSKNCVVFSQNFNFEILVQVNLLQKYLFLHQPTHNMKKDFLLNYQFSTWIPRSEHCQNMLCTQIGLNVKTKQNKIQNKIICVCNMFWDCSELGIFMYWTDNSMNNMQK